MRYVVTAEQMKAADSHMICDIGIPSLVLMERAALQCVTAMKEEKIDVSKALIVCGSGNNGGDGFAIARLLAQEGKCVDVIFVGNLQSRSKETKIQMDILERLGISIVNCLPEKEYSVIIDAVFGIGLSREVSGDYQEMIEKMNSLSGVKVAVDISSGISANTGDVLGGAFQADVTVTFAYEKIGQILYPGCEYSGKVLVKEIGIKDPLLDKREDVLFALEPSDVQKWMPKRRSDSNKGTYGKVLCITGSAGMSGAAFLSAKAAYMSGAGLVRIYTDESNRTILQQQTPEAVITTYHLQKDHPFEELEELLTWADVVCLGCGLGMSRMARELVGQVLHLNTRPCVIDADGLNILSEMEEKDLVEKLRGVPYVFTPHMKEMSRLTGHSVNDLKKNRTEYVSAYVKKIPVICALKDSRTVVAQKNKKIFINTSGNCAMAKAGAGDVLTGIITGLIAQKVSAYQAAVLGVFLHGMAGDEARKRCGLYSVLPQDVIRGVRTVLKTLEES